MEGTAAGGLRFYPPRPASGGTAAAGTGGRWCYFFAATGSGFAPASSGWSFSIETPYSGL